MWETHSLNQVNVQKNNVIVMKKSNKQSRSPILVITEGPRIIKCALG